MFKSQLRCPKCNEIFPWDWPMMWCGKCGQHLLVVTIMDEKEKHGV